MRFKGRYRRKITHGKGRNRHSHRPGILKHGHRWRANHAKMS